MIGDEFMLHNILIVDDDYDIRNLLKKSFERENFNSDIANDGRSAIYYFDKNDYDLVILDLMLPELDGIEVCKIIRQKSNIPIIMLTAKDFEEEKILGLSIGADDYITKPFNISEVIARAKSLIRRYYVFGSVENNRRISFNNMKILPSNYTVLVHQKQIQLTGKEMDILMLLSSNPNKIFTKKSIFENVWGGEYYCDDNTVMVHMRNLRKKIEKDPSNPKFIETIWGIGYKFSGDNYV